jgi:hypothetical protein
MELKGKHGAEIVSTGGLVLSTQLKRSKLQSPTTILEIRHPQAAGDKRKGDDRTMNPSPALLAKPRDCAPACVRTRESQMKAGIF